MAHDCAGSIYACGLRIARLAADGNPVVGSNQMYVSDALVRLQIAGVWRDGDDIEMVNGCGVPAVTYKAPDTLKRADLTLEIVTPDPEIQEMLVAGVDLLTKSGESRGIKYPGIGESYTDYGVSLEVWSQAIIDGAPDAELPYWRWVLPKTRNWRPGDRELAASGSVTVLTGQALQNSNWNDGPLHDWFSLADQEPDRVVNVARDSAIPTAACGYQSSPAS